MAAYLRRCARVEEGIVSMRLTFWLSSRGVAAVAASPTAELILPSRKVNVERRKYWVGRKKSLVQMLTGWRVRCILQQSELWNELHEQEHKVCPHLRGRISEDHKGLGI